MIEWYNTPFEDVIQSAVNLYGALSFEVGFHPNLQQEHEAYGMTSYLEDGTYLIDLDANTSITHLVETLAHEIAHIIVGAEENHNEKWEKVFDDIFVEYNRYTEEKYKIV